MKILGFAAVILSICLHKTSGISLKCRGSVTLYQSLINDNRIYSNKYDVLSEEKLKVRSYRELKNHFNPIEVYAYEVEGNCCWRIYALENFRGPFYQLEQTGLHGIPGYPQFNVNSMRQIPC